MRRFLPLFFLLALIAFALLKNGSSGIDNLGQIKLESERIFKECQAEGEKKWRTCYAGKFAELTKSKDFEFVLDVLHNLQDKELKIRDCHLIAHEVSAEEIRKNPDKFEEFLAKANPSECVGGFIHGALEVYKSLNPNLKLNSAETMKNICSMVGKNGGESYCFHMMGHLMMVEEVGDVNASIKICQDLESNFSYNCYTGVFMESETRTNLAAHGLAPTLPYNKDSADKQEIICRQFEGEQTRACWQELAHFYAHIAEHKSQVLFDLCSRASTEAGRDSCFLHGVTFIAGKDEDKTGPINMEILCEPYSGKNQQKFLKCMDTIIYVLLSSSSKFSEKIESLCKVSSSDLEKICLKRLKDRKESFTNTPGEFTEEEDI